MDATSIRLHADGQFALWLKGDRVGTDASHRCNRLVVKLGDVGDSEDAGSAAVLHFDRVLPIDADLVTEEAGLSRIIRFDELSTLGRKRAAGLMADLRNALAKRLLVADGDTTEHGRTILGMAAFGARWSAEAELRLPFLWPDLLVANPEMVRVELRVRISTEIDAKLELRSLRQQPSAEARFELEVRISATERLGSLRGIVPSLHLLDLSVPQFTMPGLSLNGIGLNAFRPLNLSIPSWFPIGVEAQAVPQLTLTLDNGLPTIIVQPVDVTVKVAGQAALIIDGFTMSLTGSQLEVGGTVRAGQKALINKSARFGGGGFRPDRGGDPGVGRGNHGCRRTKPFGGTDCATAVAAGDRRPRQPDRSGADLEHRHPPERQLDPGNAFGAA